MNNNDLNFVTKKARTHTGVDADVSLTLVKKGKFVSLSIDLAAAKMIGDTGYIVAARLGSRIYFKQSDAVTGFKVQFKEHSSRAYVQMPAADLKVNGDWIGFYKIWWNSERELFYIDLDRK